MLGTNQINLKLLLFTGRTFAFYLVIPSPSPALWSVINLLLTLESTRLSAIRFQSRLGAVRSLFLPQSQLIAEKEHEYDLEQFLFFLDFAEWVIMCNYMINSIMLVGVIEGHYACVVLKTELLYSSLKI